MCDECASALSGEAIRVEEVCEGVCEARPSADGREIEALPMFPVVTLAEYEGRAKNLVLDYKNGGGTSRSRNISGLSLRMLSPNSLSGAPTDISSSRYPHAAKRCGAGERITCDCSPNT